jgi:glycosidase
MPLVYGGQESFLEKRLAFFEKDPIAWREYPLATFYGQLLAHKRQHTAWANGLHGGDLQWLQTGNARVLGYRRQGGSGRLDVWVNLSALEQSFKAAEGAPLHLPAWGWHIQNS